MVPRRRTPWPHPRLSRTDGAGGHTLTELSAALAVIGLALAAGLPALASSLGRERLAGALRDVGRELVAARWSALATGRSTGLRFVRDAAGRLAWGVHADGDGDGLRSADIDGGTDPLLRRGALPTPLRAGLAAGPVPEALPPQSGWLDRPEDPIKFGAADLAVFAPAGSATPGSLYLTDGHQSVALVLNGVTGRLRLFRLQVGSTAWKEIP